MATVDATFISTLADSLAMPQLNAPPFSAGDASEESLSARFRVFSLWGSLVGVAFFSVYPTMNWWSSLQPQHHQFYLPDELHLPFIPEFIWLYLSMYVLFLTPPFALCTAELKRLARELISATIFAGVVFMLFPARLGFVRTLPNDEFYRALFLGLFSVDHPFNLVPSLHVVYSTAICLAVFSRAKNPLRFCLLIWLLLLTVSTILVHQHHLLDVITGGLLALFMRYLWEKKHV